MAFSGELHIVEDAIPNFGLGFGAGHAFAYDVDSGLFYMLYGSRLYSIDRDNNWTVNEIAIINVTGSRGWEIIDGVGYVAVELDVPRILSLDLSDGSSSTLSLYSNLDEIEDIAHDGTNTYILTEESFWSFDVDTLATAQIGDDNFGVPGLTLHSLVYSHSEDIFVAFSRDTVAPYILDVSNGVATRIGELVEFGQGITLVENGVSDGAEVYVPVSLGFVSEPARMVRSGDLGINTVLSARYQDFNYVIIKINSLSRGVILTKVPTYFLSQITAGEVFNTDGHAFQFDPVTREFTPHSVFDVIETISYV